MQEQRQCILSFILTSRKESYNILFRIFLLFFFSGFFPADTIGQTPTSVISEYAYRRYTTLDGLPQMLTECIYQDRKGYIWIGTLSGFVRYDGFEFKPFLKGKQENILSFYESPEGEITALGFRRKHLVNKEDTLSSVPFKYKGLLLNNYNSSSLPTGFLILENEEETNREICCITNDSIQPLLKNSLLDLMDNTRKVYLSQDKKIYYIPTEERVYCLKADGTPLPEINLPEVYSLLESNGHLYLFAADGIYEYANNKIKIKLAYHFLAPDYGVSACTDPKGNIFIHDAHNIYRLSQNGEIEHLVDGINLIKQMYIDRESNLWIATYQGVYNFFQMNFKNHILTDKNDILRAIEEDGHENIFAGTLNGQLLQGKKGENMNPLPYPRNKDNYFLPRASRIGDTTFFLGKGDVLACTSHTRRWLGLPFLNYQYLTAHKDSLLIATRQELFITDAKGHIRHKYDGLKGIFCVQSDNQGNIYVGTIYGLVCLQGNYQKEIVLPEENRVCTSIIAKPDGDILFSAGENLYTLRNDSAILLQKYGSLIRSIRQTQNNYLVVATINGLHITDTHSMQTMFFNQYNGFTGIEPLAAHIAETEDGTIWIPCVNQTVSFNPQELIYQYNIPSLELISAKSSTDNVNWNEIYTDNNQNIELDHSQRNLYFSYIAVSHSATGNIRYCYRLKGFQENWSQPQTRREVQFNNLPSGRYELEVIAKIGNLSSQPIHIAIHLKPAFWEHWWFWVTIFLILAASIWGLAYNYYKRRNRKNIEELKREIKLNHLLVKSIRLKSIPHFNANVLAGIEYFMMNNAVEEANKYLALYSRFTNATLLDVDKPSRSLEEEIQYVRLYLSLEKLRYEENLSYSIHIEKEVDTHIQVPNMILHTYCENAVKHGLRNKPGKGHIYIEITQIKRGINLIVTDDGIGRQAALAFSSTSTKQGLSIMAQQIELYNQRNDEHIIQTITDLVTSDGKPGGTRFELYIPYHYNYF